MQGASSAQWTDMSDTSEVPCFFCRFNLGFSIGTLEPGLAGFVVLISSLLCLCLCSGFLGLVCCYCCRSHNENHHDYAEVPVLEPEQHAAAESSPRAAAASSKKA